MTAPFERRPMRNKSPKQNWKHGALVNAKNPGNPGPNTSKMLALRLRRTAALIAQAYAVMPYLSEADRPTMRSWAELEIITSDVFNNLIREGILQKNGSGNPRQLLTVYRQLKQTQLTYEKELLMTPASRAAALGKDGGGAPIDLVAHFAKTVSDNNGETETTE
jgi:hypothetical protein